MECERKTAQSRKSSKQESSPSKHAYACFILAKCYYESMHVHVLMLSDNGVQSASAAGEIYTKHNATTSMLFSVRRHAMQFRRPIYADDVADACAIIGGDSAMHMFEYAICLRITDAKCARACAQQKKSVPILPETNVSHSPLNQHIFVSFSPLLVQCSTMRTGDTQGNNETALILLCSCNPGSCTR